LPKLRLAGERLATGAVPVPLRLAVRGLPTPLSVTVTVPLRDPVVVGLKVTVIGQLAPAARVVPQVLVWAKSPLAVIDVIVSSSVPVLLSVTVCGVLVVPTF
jgi:hypothetical protein